MSSAFSIYLDLVRFGAACLVYLYHSNQRFLVADILPASRFGHSSVIVFFVLSGFVIAYVADRKERHWTTYAASRIARVYSVAVPALVLTVLLDYVGRLADPAIYRHPFDQFIVRAGSSAAMLNEVWFVSITSFSNVPYWSICYEVWYYVAFGLILFLPGSRGYAAAAVVLFALGPKILLLAPVWAAGVALYRWERLTRMTTASAAALVAGSVAGIIAFHVYGVEARLLAVSGAIIGSSWQEQLIFSKYFLSDYVLGVLVFANFAGMRRLAVYLGPVLAPIERPVRFLAAYTFTLYLLHQPLFLFWSAVLHGDPRGHGFWWAVTGLTALSVLAIGHFTENKRQAFRTWIEERLRSLDRYRPVIHQPELGK